MKARTALVIEDTAPLGAVYRRYLQNLGFATEWVVTGAEGRDALEQALPDILLLDLQLPDMHGHEILEYLRERGAELPVVVITAHSEEQSAADAMALGAADFLEKPFTAERLKVTVDNVLDKARLSEQVQVIRRQIEREGYCGFVGRSLPMQLVYRIIDSAAGSRASVFITGESGTGKELCAQAIHQRSDRSAGPFIAVNCGAIPRDLFESEIFGHEKGAFSGAARERKGAAEQADGGTLFLDEIGEMELDLQVKLLRLIQSGRLARVGASRDIAVDVRFVCATNRDPAELVHEGRFREDLFYRLNVVPIDMPALRDRDEDLMQLAQHFLSTLSERENRQFREFHPDVVTSFSQYAWPGNVRQLHNVIHNIVLLHDAVVVEPQMLPKPLDSTSLETVATPQRPPARIDAGHRNPLRESEIQPLWLVEKQAIEAAIKCCDGNIPRAAAHLHLSPSTIYRKQKSWEEETP